MTGAVHNSDQPLACMQIADDCDQAVLLSVTAFCDDTYYAYTSQTFSNNAMISITVNQP